MYAVFGILLIIMHVTVIQERPVSDKVYVIYGQQTQGEQHVPWLH